jgi:hypothetical protein
MLSDGEDGADLAAELPVVAAQRRSGGDRSKGSKGSGLDRSRDGADCGSTAWGGGHDPYTGGEYAAQPRLPQRAWLR